MGNAGFIPRKNQLPLWRGCVCAVKLPLIVPFPGDIVHIFRNNIALYGAISSRIFPLLPFLSESFLLRFNRGDLRDGCCIVGT